MCIIQISFFVFSSYALNVSFASITVLRVYNIDRITLHAHQSLHRYFTRILRRSHEVNVSNADSANTSGEVVRPR
ncbi:unnamed protein product [Citrullus colocynthis]|uniref:Secreted protein n=1 Tax=Citrullus colocynthis TaxID=252529 RepID=A0ABP0Z6A3_9ROSI